MKYFTDKLTNDFSFDNRYQFTAWEAWIGTGGVYFVHVGVMALGILFAGTYFPETRNKSLTELENMYKKTDRIYPTIA